MITLFSSQASDGQSAAIEWRGGRGTLFIAGTIGGGTLTLQVSDGTSWVGLEGLAETAVGAYEFKASACQMRVDLSGATSPSLTVKIL